MKATQYEIHVTDVDEVPKHTANVDGVVDRTGLEKVDHRERQPCTNAVNGVDDECDVKGGIIPKEDKTACDCIEFCGNK